MTYLELVPAGRQKSFYGKARVWYTHEGLPVLRSYNTDVCMISRDRRLVRLWGGYSATTMKHVSSFVLAFAHSFAERPTHGVGKAEWCEMPVAASVWEVTRI